ncbi:MAG: DoxX family protein [Amylibacter sp.]
MDGLNKLAHPLGRIMMGLLFLLAGYGKVTNGAPIGGFIESKIPGLGFMAWPVSIFELTAGVLLIVGFQTRLTALALAGFCLFTGVVFHGFANQVIMMKDIALAGGFFILFAKGAGGLSFDKS